MNSNFLRVGGMAAILGGVYLFLLAVFQAVVNGDIENYPIIANTITIMPLLLLVGTGGLLALAAGRRAVQAGGIVIAVGAVLMAVGFSFMTWFYNDSGWSLMFLGLLVLPIGWLIFGAANWRAGLLPRWNRMPLGVGAVTTLLIFLATLDMFREQQSEFLFGIYLLVLAIGWLLLGAAMLTGKQAAAVAV